jgi:hypothetical protein
MDLRSTELLEHFIGFFESPWWKRLWTVQEHALARCVVFQYGKHILSGEVVLQLTKHLYIHLATCCTNIYDSDSGAYTSLSTCFIMLQALEHVQTTRDFRGFFYWVFSFSSREVTDPRDKIYGLLALATGDEVGLIEPDYTCSIQEVFYATAIASIERNKNLDIFSCLFGKRGTQLPSFVPDLGNELEIERYLKRLKALPLFSTSGDTIARLELISIGKLVMIGIIFDKISDTGMLADYCDSNAEFLNETRFLFNNGKLAESLYQHTGEQRESAYWTTLCGGIETHDEDGFRYDCRVRDMTDLSKFQKWEAWLKTPPPIDSSLFTTEIGYINLAFRSVTAGRRPIVTEKGYIGFAPEQCKTGDVVAVLAGGKVPYILRPEPNLDPSGKEGDPRQCYSILGDAYIHGIMDGEAVKELREKGGEMEEIILV